MARITIGPSDLETFLKVAELGSFTRAAEELGLAQPSVTNRIHRLEGSLGVKLFERTTRRVVTTDAGERLRGRAEPMLLELQALLRDFRNEAASRRYNVGVAAPPVIASVVLPMVIRRFTTANPSCTVSLRDSGSRQAALDDVQAGRVDLAVLALEGEYPQFDFNPLIADEYLLVAPRGHPLTATASVTFDDLVRHPIIMHLTQGPVLDLIAAEFEKRGLTFHPAYEASNIFTLLGLVEAGMGVTVVSRIVVPRVDPARLAVARIAELPLSRQFGVVTLRGRKISAAAKSFCAVLRDGFVQASGMAPAD